MNTVSVIVPVYNVMDFLPQCIESILTQTYKDFELLLIDDGSSDSSGAVCDEFAKRDLRIKVIHQKNQGVSHARNTGLVNATGEFILFVDSDDFISPQMLEIMLERILATDADIAECSYCEYNSQNERRNILRTYGVITGTQNIINRNLTCEISVVAWNKLYRRRVITKPFTEGENYEDILFTAQVLCNCHKIVSTEHVLYYWRQRKNSITHSGISESRYTAVEHFMQRASLYHEHNGNVGLIHSGLLIELTLEMKAVVAGQNKQQMEYELERAKAIASRFYPSLIDIAAVPSVKGKLRAVYYMYQHSRYRKLLTTSLREQKQ